MRNKWIRCGGHRIEWRCADQCAGWRQRRCFARKRAVVACRYRNVDDIDVLSRCVLARLGVLLLMIHGSVFIIGGSFILGGHVTAAAAAATATATAILLIGAFYDLHFILIHRLLLRGLQLFVRQFSHVSIFHELGE